ncbi:hypothetical protein [Cryobacterium psychrophilum]|uniref:Uncharacterized protein n=1 Tax=Cryobacterium psychrophilum TaxID=41988 RepID=A0A4Y8KJA3_9MICO|nr:hypothetical protein [Cryobacterium psychrophilum]TDW29215.1 hypothetical protein EDD25_0907 [Cryobacterium psychrophilum]TFD74661.1 hypothetical protein E3T53_17005 [Cryobacterium psychrophilum]
MTDRHVIARNASAADSSAAQRELARKLNLLLDVVVAEGNTPHTYKDIASALTAKGLSLSRARWAYMLSGSGPLVTEPALLTGIAEFFRIPAEYLRGSDDDIPERVDSQLAFVRELRANRVVDFAARTISDVSPETLRAITALLRDDITGDNAP